MERSAILNNLKHCHVIYGFSSHVSSGKYLENRDSSGGVFSVNTKSVSNRKRFYIKDVTWKMVERINLLMFNSTIKK